MPIAAILGLIGQAGSLFQQAQDAYAGIKDTLSTSEQETLTRALNDLHAKTVSMSNELDTALAAASKK